MSRITRNRRRHLGRRLTRKILTISRRAVNHLYPSHSMAVVTNRTGERFSLISLGDKQSPVASRVARTLQRESAASDQIFGFHVVCGECDGFVVRNGRVRNCPHQTYSWSSVSEISRRGGRENADGYRAQGRDGWGLNGQLPVPSLLRSGRVHNDWGPGGISRDKEAGRRGISVASDSPRSTAVTANHNADIILRTGAAAKGTRGRTSLGEDTHIEAEDSADSATVGQARCDPRALMQGWREWSERWEQVVRDDTETANSADSDVVDQPQRYPEALMEEWKEWSERWERSVKSR